MKDSRFNKTREFNWHTAERSIYDDMLLSSDARKKKAKRGKKIRRNQMRLKNIIYTIFFIILAVVSVIYMPIFNIDEIRVVGNSYISAEEACRMAGVYRGEHIFAVKTDEAQQRLLKDLRIDKASVRRLFPNGLIIEVVERRPVLTVACEYGYIDIDREGLVLAAYRQPAALPVPMLLDMKVHDLYIGDRVKEPQILAIAAFFGDIGPGVIGIQEVSISDPEHIICYTPDRTEMRIGRLEREKEKATVCRDFLAEIKAAHHHFDYIDLRFETPFVKLRQDEKQTAPIQYKPAHENRINTEGDGENTRNEKMSDSKAESKTALDDNNTKSENKKSDDEENKSTQKEGISGKKEQTEKTPPVEKAPATAKDMKHENPPKDPPASEKNKDADIRKS